MTITPKQFAQALALHGAQIERWPLALQAQAVPVQYSAPFAQLIEEAVQLEATLAGYHPVEPAHGDLATRIVRVARAFDRTPKQSLLSSLRAAFEFLLPNPALAFASVLMLGCVIGLSMPAANGDASQTISSYADTNGAML